MAVAVCTGCEFDFGVIKDIVNDTNEFMKWLREHRVIKSNLECPQCLLPCTENRATFYCTNRIEIQHENGYRTCSFSQNITNDTWFGNSKNSMEKIFETTLRWAYEIKKQSNFADNQEISKTSTVRLISLLKQICIDWCQSRSQRIGGVSVIVEVDVKKYKRWQYDGSRATEKQWLLGGYEKDTRRFFVEVISNCNADTLLEVVRRWVVPGTTIYSNCWNEYNCHLNDGYQDLTRNHDINFLDRKKNMSVYQGHICEYLWRRSVPYSQRAHSIFSIISEQYNKFGK